MSEFPPEGNPYRANEFSESSGMSGGGNAKTNKMPGALIAIAIICIVLGFGGFFSSCVGSAQAIVQMTVGSTIADFNEALDDEYLEDEIFDETFSGELEEEGNLAEESGLDSDLFEDDAFDSDFDESSNLEEAMMNQQQNMIQDMQNFSTTFAPVTVVLGVLNMILAICLGVGGILLLSRKPAGRKILMIATVLAAVFVVLRAIVQGYMQIQIIGMMKEAMEGMPDAAGGGDAEMVATFMNVGIWFGICFTVVWTLALVVFYLWSHVYLKSRRVTDFFAGKAAASVG